MVSTINNPLRGPRLAIAVLAILALAVVGRSRCHGADDTQAERDRKAKAAIAVARSMPAPKAVATGPSVAPAPRPVTPKDYATGHKESLTDQSVLVVYVACDGPRIDGAITCVTKNETFGQVKGPAVVIGYPMGDRLYVEKVIPCPADPESLTKAVKDAARKIDGKGPAKQMPAAPRPLNLQIQYQRACNNGVCQLVPLYR